MFPASRVALETETVLRTQISLKALAVVCRTLSTLLYSGVGVVRALEVASRKTRDTRCDKALAEMVLLVRAGEQISDAMVLQQGRFPALMIDMVRMSENSGALPEVLEHLAEHFENNLKLRRQFLGKIAWPVMQFVMAVMVIALLIYVLGMMPGEDAEALGGRPMSDITFGLKGAGGAVQWMVMVFGFTAMLLMGYLFVASSVASKKIFDRLMLGLPVVGTCMQSFAIARFSWAYYLTQQAGMPVRNSLAASLRATGNGAFEAMTDPICREIEAGSTLTQALADSLLFPVDFIEMVDVGERSGTVPEQLYRLSPHFQEQARRSMSMMCSVISWMVWGAVAAFILYFVFSFFLWYIDLINAVAA